MLVRYEESGCFGKERRDGDAILSATRIGVRIGVAPLFKQLFNNRCIVV